MPTDPSDTDQEYRIMEAIAAHRRGWTLMPLRGKIPTLRKWPSLPRPTEADVIAWARAGNLGLRTGSVSGVYVVDVDPGGAWDAPPTPTVITGRGGRHLYYAAPTPCPGNSASALAPHVDTRGEGGQVVYVGSVHPDTGAVYRWADGCSPDELPLQPWVPIVPAPPPGNRYGQAALSRELQRLTSAPEGRRNIELNRVAFSLGQLVGGHVLEYALVESHLISAAVGIGLPVPETSRTIRSGLTAGISRPRAPQIRSVPHAVPGPAPVETDDSLPEVLVPGSHTCAGGEYVEIGTDDFADAVIAALPGDLLYRRADVVGELIGEPGEKRFAPLTVSRGRLLIDHHVRLVRWKQPKAAPDPVKHFRPCGPDESALVLAQAISHPTIRELRLLSRFPVYAPDLCAPGWNGSGVYYDGATITPCEDVPALLDLVTDFPFQSASDRENFFGALLTPIMRPAINGNIPLHLVVSTVERAGKTKLIEQVLGRIILGVPTPAIQFGGSEEETDKRIISLLLWGEPVAHLDNLREFMDSAALASLLTAATYSGRLLGANRIVSAPNHVTLIASGNNVRASAEIIRRTVPIRLRPEVESPEERTDFAHPDLPSYLQTARPGVLAALLGAVERWRASGCAQAGPPMGGYEEWSATIGGILAASGLSAWRANDRDWRRLADPDTADLAGFIAAWSDRYGPASTTAASLLAICDEESLFQSRIRGTTDRGRVTSFTSRILGKFEGRIVAGRRIVSGGKASWCLEIA